MRVLVAPALLDGVGRCLLLLLLWLHFRGWWRDGRIELDVVEALLLVLDDEPNLPVRGVGRVRQIAPLLRSEELAPSADLLRVRARRPRHCWDGDAVGVQMPSMGEVGIWVGESLPVLLLPLELALVFP